MFGEGILRRSFLLMMGSTVLGRFRLPVQETEAASGSESGAALAMPSGGSPTSGPLDPEERVVRLASRPIWDEDERFLLWMERTDSGSGVKAMMCFVTTEEDRAEARRFCEIAAWRSWRTDDELAALVSEPGPWLVRLNRMCYFWFLSTDDETTLMEAEELGEVFAANPEYAARVTSAWALELIRFLTEEWGLAEIDDYLEPVRPEDAMKDRRAQLFARPSQSGQEPQLS